VKEGSRARAVSGVSRRCRLPSLQRCVSRASLPPSRPRPDLAPALGSRCCSNFGGELADFQRLMNSVKRGDIVGVNGHPGKSKRGELSIFPQSVQVGAGWGGGLRRGGRMEQRSSSEPAGGGCSARSSGGPCGGRVAAWAHSPPLRPVSLPSPPAQVLAPCLHMPPGAHFGLKDQVRVWGRQGLGGG
jgi:hypothetical protein